MTEAGGVTRSSAVAGDGQQTLAPQSPVSTQPPPRPLTLRPDTMYPRSLGPLLGKLHVHLYRADHKQLIIKGCPSNLSTDVIFVSQKKYQKRGPHFFEPFPKFAQIPSSLR